MGVNRQFFFATILVTVFFSHAQSDISTVGTLPEQIAETSGLIYYNGRLITHNDSGGNPELYELDPETLGITRVVQITNAENRDWEDIAQDEQFIYIGDFGNNSGSRQDLVVYKVPKSEYARAKSICVSFSLKLTAIQVAKPKIAENAGEYPLSIKIVITTSGRI